jgi:hypothetical protein
MSTIVVIERSSEDFYFFFVRISHADGCDISEVFSLFLGCGVDGAQPTKKNNCYLMRFKVGKNFDKKIEMKKQEPNNQIVSGVHISHDREKWRTLLISNNCYIINPKTIKFQLFFD